jgi:hypothetical protein
MRRKAIIDSAWRQAGCAHTREGRDFTHQHKSVHIMLRFYIRRLPKVVSPSFYFRSLCSTPSEAVKKGFCPDLNASQNETGAATQAAHSLSSTRAARTERRERDVWVCAAHCNLLVIKTNAASSARIIAVLPTGPAIITAQPLDK